MLVVQLSLVCLVPVLILVWKQASPMAAIANDTWKAANPRQGEFLFRNNVIYVVLLWGRHSTTNFIWCIDFKCTQQNLLAIIRIKKLTHLFNNYLFAALARHYLVHPQFFFYGMGESKLGNGPGSWILHIAFIILVANMWGLVLKEWKGANKKTITTITIGIITIILSVLLVELGK